MTSRIFRVWAVLCISLFVNGCGSQKPPSGNLPSGGPINVSLVQVANCSGTPAATLPNYDRLSAQFLDETTRHPADNLWGGVIWGTRYYLESLLTAYEATANPKYIKAFLDSGQAVLNLIQTMTVVDVPDPGQPLASGTGPQLTVTGWPTKLGSFSVPATVTTQTGTPALYAQSLDPAIYFEVKQQSGGGLQLVWTDANNNVLEADTVETIADLYTIASKSLFWAQSVEDGPGQSVGRIKPTGAGLPVANVYLVNNPETTIWNAEQGGGILLPFAHFLLLAKENPGLVSKTTEQQWTSTVLNIAASYENNFISDSDGGLRLHNPLWLPNALADLDVPTDYFSAEATLRLFLYQLTGDVHQFTIAQGLISHQELHWSTSSQGWFLLQLWPDLVPWSSRADAPTGSIWDSFEFDPSTPSDASGGGFFVDLLHYAKIFETQSYLGLTSNIYNSNRAAFQQYLLYGPGVINGPAPLERDFYPTESSTVSDPISPSQDPLVGAEFLTPEVANQSVVNANWNWMLKYGQMEQGPIGYFLRAWARSEAAELNVCNYPE